MTIEALFNTVMGAFDFEIISENNRTLGAITFFPFMIIVQNAYCSQRLLNYTDELFCRSPRRRAPAVRGRCGGGYDDKTLILFF